VSPRTVSESDYGADRYLRSSRGGYALGPGKGRELSALGAELTVKAAGPYTAAAFAVADAYLPAG